MSLPQWTTQVEITDDTKCGEDVEQEEHSSTHFTHTAASVDTWAIS